MWLKGGKEPLLQWETDAEQALLLMANQLILYQLIIDCCSWIGIYWNITYTAQTIITFYAATFI